jgi:4,5-DOPA dioxygenase extradiol
MDRKKFIKHISMAALITPFMKINALSKLAEEFSVTEKMPLLFVGHGSPMNAILENKFHKEWQKLGKNLPKPKAILVISAHWVSHGKTKVTAMKTPKTIHDFGGFPDALFQQQYSASGSPELAKETIKLVHKIKIEEDHHWGLDHGTCSVLKPMFPKAEIPVYQISIDYSQPADFHFQLGAELAKLRHRGVLIVGSGNIVHNLSTLKSGIKAYDWTQEFDTKIADFINDRDFKSAVDFQKLGKLAKIAHPTYDHFLPLLYTLGMVETKDEIYYFNDDFDMGSISMRSLLIK